VRIVILVSGLPPERIGGAEVQAMHVAMHLAARHDVTVLTRTSVVPPELASLPRCRVELRRVPPLPGLRFLADIVATVTRLGASRREVDVILAYQTVIDGLLGVLA